MINLRIIMAVSLLASSMVSLGEDPASSAKNIGQASDKGFSDVTADRFDVLRSGSPKPVVLDVRTPEEYAKGHIPGALLLDFHSPKFAEELAKLPREKSYLVHCGVGVRSTKTCEMMHRIGFTNLVNLQGGIRAWQAAGKPVEK